MSTTMLTDVAHAYCASTSRPADSFARLRFWIDHFGQRDVKDITPDDVDAGLLALKNRGKMVPRRNAPAVPSGKPMADATLTRYAADLGGLYRYAKRQRLVPRTWTPPTKGLITQRFQKLLFQMTLSLRKPLDLQAYRYRAFSLGGSQIHQLFASAQSYSCRLGRCRTRY